VCVCVRACLCVCVFVFVCVFVCVCVLFQSAKRQSTDKMAGARFRKEQKHLSLQCPDVLYP
jgi:preprotein translocase subunit SecG